MRLPLATLLCAAALGCADARAADHGSGHADGMLVTPDAASVRWQPGPPSLPKGVEVSPLSGDPAKPGAFVLRVKVPPQTVIAPHTHAQAETLTILSGAIHHQHGTKLDRTKGAALRAGGFVYLPQDMPHALWTTDEPVELQVNGTGPFGLTYLDPADDPSRAAAR